METLLLYDLVQERNARETFPFVAIHDSNATLLKEADAWHDKCEQLERRVVAQQESLERVAAAAGSSNFKNSNSKTTGDNDDEKKIDKRDDKIVELHYAESAALKNERKMREELERLRGQVNLQEERHQKDAEELRDANRERTELKELCTTQERNVSELKDENERQVRALEHLTTQVSDCEQRANLAEQQCIGLKDTIRIIQEESDGLKKENRQLETRLIDEKNRLSTEVNSLNEMVEQLRKESDGLQSLKKQEEKRKSWFGFSSSGSEDTVVKATPIIETKNVAVMKSFEVSRRQLIPENSKNSRSDNGDDDRNDTPTLAVVPTKPNQMIQAHRHEVACVRYV
jgi:chromosome segregation ATPase